MQIFRAAGITIVEPWPPAAAAAQKARLEGISERQRRAAAQAPDAES
jgi:hypothetical protein